MKRGPRREPQGAPLNFGPKSNATTRLGMVNLRGMEFPRRPYAVPRDAPVVVHRHGDRSRRRSIAVIVDDTDYATPEEFADALARWRRRIGGWVTKSDAASQLSVSTKMVDQLRDAGRLKSRLIHGIVAIDLGSLQDELDLRAKNPDQFPSMSRE